MLLDAVLCGGMIRVSVQMPEGILKLVDEGGRGERRSRSAQVVWLVERALRETAPSVSGSALRRAEAERDFTPDFKEKHR